MVGVPGVDWTEFMPNTIREILLAYGQVGALEFEEEIRVLYLMSIFCRV